MNTCELCDGEEWTKLPTMSHIRSGAGASTFNGGILVTGGLDGYLRLSSTEMFTYGTWKPGPELPSAMAYHCQLNTKDGVILAGRL